MEAPFVYFIKPIGRDGPIKIGCSLIPEGRLLNLAAWSPWPLELIGKVPGDLKDEGFLHDCFCELHSHHEWFHSTPELRAEIAAILAAGSLDHAKQTLTRKGSIRRKRPPRSENHRLYMSYSARIRHAENRLDRADPEIVCRAPEDVNAILSRWICRGGRPPTPEEVGRLDEFLANPEAGARKFPRLRVA